MGRNRIELRAARPGDAEAVAAVHVASWRAAYRGLLPPRLLEEPGLERRTAQWRSLLSAPTDATLLAFEGDAALGFVSAGASRDDDDPAGGALGEVYALYLHPGAWRRGVGARLWRAAVARLADDGFDAVSAWVLKGNAAARAFYEAMGLVPDGWEKSEWRAGMLLDQVRYRGPLAPRASGPPGRMAPTREEPRMSEHVYKKIELTGSSPEGIEQAVANAVAKAGETMRNLRWFEVVETRGHIEDGRIAHWQVTIKVGFTLET